MSNLNFEPGDNVRLRLAKKEIEGRVLESPDSGILLLKLKSGYNVGIPKENVLAGRALKKFRSEEKGGEDVLVEQKKGLKNIGMIVTGGTIASKLDPRTGGVAPLTEIGEFAKFYPELFDMVNVVKVEIPFMIASENMGPEHWIKIAECAEKMLNSSEISGVVVTHGTDTLHYTSAALSFFLRELGKPVILTYAQRSIDRASSDANLNLQCAAKLAISDISGVYLVGHSSSDDDFCFAMSGAKVKKLHSTRRDAFRVVNGKPIAKVWPNKVEFMGEHKRRFKGNIKLEKDFNRKVALLKYYPGQDPNILDYYALKYKGLVIEGSGLGHVPTSEVENSWIAKIKNCVRDGMTICMTSQTIFGRVDPYVYSNGRQLLDAGVIFLEDMLSEVAFVKLGWVLGHYGWQGKAKEKMLENFAGELGEHLSYD